ncbi:MAG: rhomboid family intramembrane serine protease [Bdellovibrio sp.]
MNFNNDLQRARKLHSIIEKSGLDKATKNLASQYCGMGISDQKCFVDFSQILYRSPASLKSFSGYNEYTNSKTTYETERLKDAREADDLMRGNFNIKSSFLVLVRHEGWFHLIGNMLVFLAFAIPLEQKLGAIWLVLFYVAGGFVSNIMQLPFLYKGIALIGASGAVSAIVGAFAAFYWKEKMAVIVSFFFVLNKKILMPSWIYISIFFVLSDLTGILKSTSNVAHIAHLAGFSFGLLAGYFYLELKAPENRQGVSL